MLGVGITPVNLPRALRILETWRTAGKQGYVCCVSAHGLVESQRDPDFGRVLSGAAMTTEDGMPLVWWCRHAGFKDAGRACGRDLLMTICEGGVQLGYRHYFYGGTPTVVEQLVSNLTQLFPGLIVAGYRSPPFHPLTPEEEAAEVATINEARPDFVWVGLGTPKQDKWMAQHIGEIDATALLGVGAAFDFVAGAKRVAPVWMQRSGLEWMFRLGTEPRRLARRYLVGNAIFVVKAMQQLFGLRSYTKSA
jgi:N-acetylglucosaminyldiphosphoundecaprenol N-acetyl-beta-D-mannosaminyltransferase